MILLKTSKNALTQNLNIYRIAPIYFASKSQSK